MEDTLREVSTRVAGIIIALVLILVLMEDTLRDTDEESSRTRMVVLILVLMEDTLRVMTKSEFRTMLSLNPCFNGRYSQSRSIQSCLNS